MIKDINPNDESLLDDNSRDITKPTDIGDTKPDDPPKVPSVGKGSKKREAPCPIEEFARQLETNNRSLESFMLLGALGRMPSKNISYCCLMSSKSFGIYNRLVKADKMDKWRDQITPSAHSQHGVPKYINYGVVSKTNSLLKIYSEDPPNHFNGVVLQIPLGASFPSMKIPNWKELLIVYRGGAISGSLPPKLKFLGLEDFKGSINVNWKELFMGVTKLKILLTDSCEVFKNL
uniref:DUF4283 domain-containing protein n=1 Tax=Strongyloides papillosus TaxID=174720 RepID=A0A0N5BJR0_STREA